MNLYNDPIALRMVARYHQHEFLREAGEGNVQEGLRHKALREEICRHLGDKDIHTPEAWRGTRRHHDAS